MGRRTVLMVVAFLVAATGAALVFAYVSRADNRAIADQKPELVLVVKRLIGQGTSVRDAEKAGAFELKRVAASSIAQGALSDLAPVRDLSALAPLFPGEQLLRAKFGAATAGSALLIPPGKLAISVQLTDPARVAGFVVPGSEVAVFASVSVSVNGKPATDVTEVLLPRVTVLAVGPTTAVRSTTPGEATNTEALPRAIMTFALTQEEAARVIFASGKGDLYLGLLDKDSRTGKTAPVTILNLFP